MASNTLNNSISPSAIDSTPALDPRVLALLQTPEGRAALAAHLNPSVVPASTALRDVNSRGTNTAAAPRLTLAAVSAQASQHAKALEQARQQQEMQDVLAAAQTSYLNEMSKLSCYKICPGVAHRFGRCPKELKTPRDKDVGLCAVCRKQANNYYTPAQVNARLNLKAVRLAAQEKQRQKTINKQIKAMRLRAEEMMTEEGISKEEVAKALNTLRDKPSEDRSSDAKLGAAMENLTVSSESNQHSLESAKSATPINVTLPAVSAHQRKTAARGVTGKPFPFTGVAVDAMDVDGKRV